MSQYTDNLTLLNAVTTSTVGQAFDISKREQLGFQLTAASITSGNGVFAIDFSNDGTNWINNAALQDATATASTTYVTTKTLTSNTTAGMLVPLSPWKWVRARCNVTTDGAYSVIMESNG